MCKVHAQLLLHYSVVNTTRLYRAVTLHLGIDGAGYDSLLRLATPQVSQALLNLDLSGGLLERLELCVKAQCGNRLLAHHLYFFAAIPLLEAAHDLVLLLKRRLSLLRLRVGQQLPPNVTPWVFF